MEVDRGLRICRLSILIHISAIDNWLAGGIGGVVRYGTISVSGRDGGTQRDETGKQEGEICR